MYNKKHEVNMVAVVFAMIDELKEFKKFLNEIKEEIRDNQTFYVSKINNTDVVFCHSNVGKVNAAIQTTILALNYHPDLIINCGCAGSTNPNVKVGDVVISSVAGYHDFDIPKVLDEQGWIRSFDNPLLSFKASNDVLKIAKNLNTDIKIHTGGICTGDCFVYRKEQLDTILKYYPDCLCADMEGTAVGHACTFFNIPFVIIRSISDNTLVKGNEVSYNFDYHKACEISANLSKEIIEQYEMV